jgi:hypothetical protein
MIDQPDGELHVHIHAPEFVAAIRDLIAVITRNTRSNVDMSKEMDELINSAHRTMDTEDAALAVVTGLRDQINAASSDPAAMKALAAELDAKRATIAAAIANTNEAGPNPIAIEPAPNPAPAPEA